MNDHPFMITLYLQPGLDESYYNNSPIAQYNQITKYLFQHLGNY